MLLFGGCQLFIYKIFDGILLVEDIVVEIKVKLEKYGFFSEDSLYLLLVVELVGQCNCFDIVLSNYVVQVQKICDFGVFECVFCIVEYFGVDQEVFDIFLFWVCSVLDNFDV